MKSTGLGLDLKPVDISLIQTDADEAWVTPQYLMKRTAMDRECTVYITKDGENVIGIEA